MKQKLGLSCALIHQPRLLLLDEPTFGVDPISRRDLWLIVHEMVAEGVTVVVSTAYMDEAERFDRVGLLHEGRLLNLDRPEALRATLEGRLLAVRASVGPRAVRAATLDHPAVRHASVFGDRLHVAVESDETDGPALQTALRAAGFEDADVAPVEPTMEDVFIDRVRAAAAGGES
jgi:ABC-2 type transport system ATP-binding protein